MQTVICTNVTKPPIFMSEQYEEYRRAMNWRTQLQGNIPAGRLLAAVGLNETGPAKWVLGDYFQQTLPTPNRRPVEGFLKEMDSLFKRESEDLPMRKLTARSDFKKKSVKI